MKPVRVEVFEGTSQLAIIVVAKNKKAVVASSPIHKVNR